MEPLWEYLPCTIKDKEDVLRKYERSAEMMAQDVESVKSWINQQPHLPANVLTDVIVEKFIMLAKCSVEMAKKRLEMYLSLRTYYPDLYEYMDPASERLENVKKCMIALPMPKLTKNNNRVLLFSFQESFVNEDYDCVAMFLYILCILEVRLQYDYRVHDVQICDMKNVKFTHLSRLTPMLMKTMLTIIQETFGNRIHKVIFANTPSILEKVITLFKSLVSAKIAQRVEVYKDFESVFDVVPKEIFPKEYGGSEESMFVLQEIWHNKILEQRPWILTLNEIKIDRKLIPERKNDEYLGYEGNFRKLDFD